MAFINMQNLAGINAVVSYTSFNILRVRLKNAHLRPKNWCFGGFDPVNEEHSHRDPQKALPCAKTRRMMY